MIRNEGDISGIEPPGCGATAHLLCCVSKINCSIGLVFSKTDSFCRSIPIAAVAAEFYDSCPSNLAIVCKPPQSFQQMVKRLNAYLA
ncbi:hypothetical protein D8I35_02210 [Corticibacter populi]|uniref:Uncharacterized protein n=1 Tax=Corticibacter populi TaxID=1550736 RepID=A0A3M6QY72_9BURK|nr:hypothetical protein D8I35_02210 [Corticibacter populi]